MNQDTNVLELSKEEIQKRNSEMRSAYIDVAHTKDVVICEMIKSYVRSCIVIPKYLSKTPYNTSLRNDQVRVIDHSDFESDLFTMMTYVVEEMQNNSLDRECTKEMFQHLLNLSFENEERNIEDNLI
tara:strand:- start:52 stop:432 length:381 start_codon:yes stop_codon:yes gene_type:complete